MDVKITDDAGTTHAAAGAEARILSLVPSITELLFDLGLADRIVGRTAFCVHPAARVVAVPSVGGTKRVSMDKVLSTGATHAIVNIDENPKALADELSAAGLSIVVTHPLEVDDNLSLFRLMGALFDRNDEAAALCDEFQAASGDLRAAARTWPLRQVLYLIWQDPWMTVSRDTYIARFLAEAGWQTIGHDAAVRYPEIAMSEDVLADVDAVLFSTEPYSFTEAHLSAFRQTFPSHAHKARLIDAEMVSWYGSRAIAGLRYLRRFAAPEAA